MTAAVFVSQGPGIDRVYGFRYRVKRLKFTRTLARLVAMCGMCCTPKTMEGPPLIYT